MTVPRNPSVTFSGTTTDSTKIDLAGKTPCGLFVPSGFSGASVTFKAATSLDGTYSTIRNNDGDVSITVTAGKYSVLDPADFAGVAFLQIISASSETDKTIEIATRPV